MLIFLRSQVVIEPGANLIGHTGEIELHGEALLEPVGLVHVLHVDAVERLLGGANDAAVLVGDVLGDFHCGSVEFGPRHDLEHRTVVVQLLCGERARGVEHGPHQVLGDQAGQVGGRTERAAVDLGEAEGRVVGGDDDIGIADQADAAAEAEAVDGGDDRYFTVVDRGEGGEAAVVRANEGGMPGIRVHLLDIHTGVEAPALGAQHDDLGLRVAAGRGHGIGEREPSVGGQSVDRRVVDSDDFHAFGFGVTDDSHRASFELELPIVGKTSKCLVG